MPSLIQNNDKVSHHNMWTMVYKRETTTVTVLSLINAPPLINAPRKSPPTRENFWYQNIRPSYDERLNLISKYLLFARCRKKVKS